MTSSFAHQPNILAASLLRAQEHYARRVKQQIYRENPVLWAQERLGLSMWSKQAEIAMAIVANNRVAVKSSHSIGKSFLAAILVLWWIDTHIGEDVYVLTTAPTGSAVTGIVWEYVRKLHRGNNFIGTITEQAQWKDDNRDIIGWGTKPAENNNAAFSGRHYKYTLVLIDEACGVPESLFTAAESITTTDTCRILAIGNPVDPSTAFGDIFLSHGGAGSPAWEKYTISSYDTPNFTGEEVPQDMRDNLISVATVSDWRDKWGPESNEFKIRALGEFPESSNSKMFPLHLLYKGINTIIVPGADTRCVLGVDVARFGNDSTTVIRYHDGDTSIEGKWDHIDTMETAQRVHEIAVRLNAWQVRIDETGVGAGVLDRLQQLVGAHDYSVWGMVGAASSPDQRKYLNARAWWHQNVYDMLHEGRLHLPDTTHDHNAMQLFEEMRELEKRYDSKWGALQLESKDDMRRRKVKSPDFSDALIYSCCPVGDPEDPINQYGPGDLISYDPMDDPGLFEGRSFVISPL